MNKMKSKFAEILPGKPEKISMVSCKFYDNKPFKILTVELSKFNAMKVIGHCLGSPAAVNFNIRTVDAVINNVFSKYDDFVEKQITKNLSSLSDDTDDIEIVNRLSMLKKFIRTDFANENRYTDEDKTLFNEFKLLNAQNRELVIENLSSKLYAIHAKKEQLAGV